MNPLQIGPQIGPVTVGTPEHEKEALLAAALTALAVAFPKTAEKLTGLTTGVKINPATLKVTPTPLIIMNGLPFPFGLIPPEAGGIRKSWYLPKALGQDLPSIVPGSDELRADAARAKSDYISERERDEAVAFQKQLTYISREAIETALKLATTPGNPNYYVRPDTIAALASAELERRAQQTLTDRVSQLGYLTAEVFSDLAANAPGTSAAAQATLAAINGVERGAFYDKIDAVMSGDP